MSHRLRACVPFPEPLAWLFARPPACGLSDEGVPVGAGDEPPPLDRLAPFFSEFSVAPARAAILPVEPGVGLEADEPLFGLLLPVDVDAPLVAGLTEVTPPRASDESRLFCWLSAALPILLPCLGAPSWFACNKAATFSGLAAFIWSKLLVPSAFVCVIMAFFCAESPGLTGAWFVAVAAIRCSLCWALVAVSVSFNCRDFWAWWPSLRLNSCLLPTEAEDELALDEPALVSLKGELEFGWDQS